MGHPSTDRCPDATAAPTRFLVDAMLGNVARDLRLLGYDAQYLPDALDAELLRRAQAEALVLVTRDRALAARSRGVRCVLVAEASPPLQVVEVLAALGVGAGPNGPFSRCLVCGGPLAALQAEAALPGLPDHLATCAGPFASCARCGRTFWAGSHAQRLQARVREILALPRDSRRHSRQRGF